MMPLGKKTAFFLACGIWVITLLASFAGKRWLESRTPPLPEIPQSFAFASPDAEELALIEGEKAHEGYFSLPIMKALPVFACAKKTCPQIGALEAGSELQLNLEMIDGSSEWLPVPWNNAEGGGFVSVYDLESAYQEPPPPPTRSFDPASFELGMFPDAESIEGIDGYLGGASSAEEEPALPADPVPIDPQTIVGIVCQFDSEDGGISDRRMTRGSGAIITEDGHVVTARSVVDLSYMNEGLETYKLTKCLVGQLPKSEPLPSIEAIRKINAFIRVPYLAYEAEVSYLPSDENLSDYEKAWLDFAVMKISKVNPDVQFFGGPEELPDSFPAAPILVSELPPVGENTLNFAYPSGTSVGHHADVRTLFMQGLVSHITGYWAGDRQYANDLFLIESHLDTEDTAGGRFGSPIFWKGYVVGIHTAKQQQSRRIYNIAAKAALENMFEGKFVIPLDAR